MSYKYLTINDRNKIEVLHDEGYSSRSITKILGFHHSSISRELKRCKQKYRAVEAQNNKEKQASRKGRKVKATNDLKQIIIEKLKNKCSSEQIVGSFNIGRSIRNRPKEMKKRMVFGH